jgi:hypothetical protein
VCRRDIIWPRAGNAEVAMVLIGQLN